MLFVGQGAEREGGGLKTPTRTATCSIFLANYLFSIFGLIPETMVYDTFDHLAGGFRRGFAKWANDWCTVFLYSVRSTGALIQLSLRV